MSKIFPISQMNSFLLQKFEKPIPLYQKVCFTGSLVTVNHCALPASSNTGESKVHW